MPVSGDKLLAKANEAITRNNPDYAIQLLQSKLKADPGNAEGNSLYLQAIQKKYQTVKAPKPKGSMGLLKLTGLQKLKKWESLADACRSHLPGDPNNLRIMEMMADALIHQGFHEAAIPYLNRWVDLDNKSAIALYWLAVCQREIGQLNEALENATQAMLLDKMNKAINDFYRDISAAQLIKSHDMESAKELKDIVADKDAMQRTAEEARELRPDERRQRIEELGGIEGAFAEKDAKKLRQIAEHYEKIPDYKLAIITWRKIYELDPTNVEALDHAGDLTIKALTGQVRKAKEAGEEERAQEFQAKKNAFMLQDFKRRVEAHPTDLGLHFRYGEILYENQQFEAAARELQRATKDPKIQDRCFGMLARAFLEINQFDLSIMNADKAMESSRSDEVRLSAMYFKGKAYLGKGQRPEAKAVFMEIMSEDFGYKDVSEIVNGELSDI